MTYTTERKHWMDDRWIFAGDGEEIQDQIELAKRLARDGRTVRVVSEESGATIFQITEGK